MTKRILLLEKCPEGKISKENMFYHIVSDVEIKIDKEEFPDNVFFFKNNKVLFSPDSKNDCFDCSFELYWTFFQNEIGMEYNKIKSFTKKMVDKYFTIKTSCDVEDIEEFDEAYYEHVEEHF